MQLDYATISCAECRKRRKILWTYSSGIHFWLSWHVNCLAWQVTCGQSGGSSLPSRQSGEKSHFHFIKMHFCPSAHRNISGPLHSSSFNNAPLSEVEKVSMAPKAGFSLILFGHLDFQKDLNFGCHILIQLCQMNINHQSLYEVKWELFKGV